MGFMLEVVMIVIISYRKNARQCAEKNINSIRVFQQKFAYINSRSSSSLSDKIAE